MVDSSERVVELRCVSPDSHGIYGVVVATSEGVDRSRTMGQWSETAPAGVGWAIVT